MRVHVEGEGHVADRLRELVSQTHPFRLSDSFPAFTFQVYEHEGTGPHAKLQVDSADGPFEQVLFRELRAAVRRNPSLAGLGLIELEADGGNQDPKCMNIGIPTAWPPARQDYIASALWVALCTAANHGRPSWWRRALGLVVIFTGALQILLSSPAAAQTNEVTQGAGGDKAAPWVVTCVNPSSGLLESCAGSSSGGGGTTDVDDASIAGGQTGAINLSLLQLWNGSAWVRAPGDATNGLKVQGTFWQATQPISASSLPLPTGAATSALQTTGNSSLSSVDGKLPALVTGRIPVDGSGVTQPVSGTFWPAAANAPGSYRLSDGAAFYNALKPADTLTKVSTVDTITNTVNVAAASLPLPTGAATSALQTTGNSSLSSIDGKVPALVSGRTPVDGSGVTQPVSAAALPLPTGAATSALQTTGNTSLASIDTKITTGSASTAGTETAVLTRPITTNRISSVVAFAATTDTATVSVEGYAGATCFLAAGTLAATMGIEVSFDGLNWLAFTFFRDGNTLATAISLPLTNPNAARIIYPMFGTGVKAIRMRPAAYTSGTAQGFCAAGMVTDPLSLSPAAGPVGIAPGLNFPNQVGGIDGSGLLRQLQLRNAAVGTGTYALAVGLSPDSPLPAGTNGIGKLTANSGVVIGDVNAVPPTLTKGTQGSTGFSTQDLKDAGRTAVIYYATAAAAGTTGTETAITLTKASGTSATSTAASFVVTSGKRFRVQQLLVSAVGHATATTQATTFSFRINTAGAVTTASTPIVWKGRVQTPATSLAYQQISLPIPDGYEILGDGTLQFGITANAVFVTNAPTWDVTLIGYEY